MSYRHNIPLSGAQQSAARRGSAGYSSLAVQRWVDMAKQRQFRWMETIRRKSYLTRISGGNLLNGLTIDKLEPRQSITWLKEPIGLEFEGAHQENDYNKFIKMPEPEICETTVGNEFTAMMKISREMEHRFARNPIMNFNEFIRMIERLFIESIDQEASREILAALMGSAGCGNFGNKAGVKYGNIKAGTPTAPWVWNQEVNGEKENSLHQLYIRANAMFNQHGLKHDFMQRNTGTTQKLVIMPDALQDYFQISQLAKEMGMMNCDIICDMFMRGTVPERIQGFDTIFEPCLTNYFREPPAGNEAHGPVMPIIMLFAGCLNYTPIVAEFDMLQGAAPEHHRDKYWTGEAYYAFDIFHKEGIAIFWVQVPDLFPDGYVA